MKHSLLWSGLCIIFVAVYLLAPNSIHAQQSANMHAATAVICTNVIDRQPVEPGTSFSSSVGRLYCYSKITDIQNPTEIVHVWYFGDAERARITLSVNPPRLGPAPPAPASCSVILIRGTAVAPAKASAVGTNIESMPLRELLIIEPLPHKFL